VLLLEGQASRSEAHTQRGFVTVMWHVLFLIFRHFPHQSHWTGTKIYIGPFILNGTPSNKKCAVGQSFLLIGAASQEASTRCGQHHRGQ
jgi:hypothetical protein